MSTIAAISTPGGRGGIGIVRLSGESAVKIGAQLFRCSKNFADIPDRYMTLGKIDADGIFEQALCVVFRSPNSYTGEDVVEFHCHGGVALTQKVLRAAIAAGAVPASRGEFTKRAFLNGKLKLSDAEGIADMINAEGEASLNAAFRLMSGELSKRVTAMQFELLDLIAYLEAAIDYPYELEDEAVPSGKNKIEEILSELVKLLATKERGKMIKDGISVAIIGLPNAGKSSLLNCLLKEERAIVTDIEGTTRDVVEDMLVYRGEVIRLLDTAGIRDTDNVIERIGIERSEKAVRGADAVILLLDGAVADDRESKLFELVGGKKCLVCVNKGDIPLKRKLSGIETVISAKTGEGVEGLLDKLLSITCGMDTDGELLTNERHVDAVRRAVKALNSALENYDSFYMDCILTDLREAYDALGEITGNTARADIIEAIFDKFCVGK